MQKCQKCAARSRLCKCAGVRRNVKNSELLIARLVVLVGVPPKHPLAPPRQRSGRAAVPGLLLVLSLELLAKKLMCCCRRYLQESCGFAASAWHWSLRLDQHHCLDWAQVADLVVQHLRLPARPQQAEVVGPQQAPRPGQAASKERCNLHWLRLQVLVLAAALAAAAIC